MPSRRAVLTRPTVTVALSDGAMPGAVQIAFSSADHSLQLQALQQLVGGSSADQSVIVITLCTCWFQRKVALCAHSDRQKMVPEVIGSLDSKFQGLQVKRLKKGFLSSSKWWW
jgi:hypothetical protein